LPRKTDANNPADWLWIAESDVAALRLAVEHEVAFHACRGKLAEILEKILKAELIRIGWPLEKTHDLQRLRDALIPRNSDLAVPVKSLCDSLAEAYMVTRYPGFDLDDPDWPTLRRQLDEVAALLATVKGRLKTGSN
jgi:HEPN domain-containing protein